MNGKVMAKLSDWTSTIAKLNVANKYGQKNYSIKAYPSPLLTPAEKEIVFRCAQKAGYDPREGSLYDVGEREGDYHHDCKYLYDTDGQDEDEDAIVAENRYKLIDQYYNRTQPTPKSRDLSPFFEYNKKIYDGLNIILEDLSLEDELSLAKQLFNAPVGNSLNIERNVKITFNRIDNSYGLENTITTFHAVIKKFPEGWRAIRAYMIAGPQLKFLFLGYNKSIAGTDSNVYIGDDFFLSHVLYYLLPHYLEDAIGDLCWCDLRNQFYKAMPQKVIDYISQELTDFAKTGRFDNDLYETQSIDRMEKCVVSELDGFKIDLVQQMENVKKLYRNDNDSFTVFYDVKTMQPFMGIQNLDEQVYKQKCVQVNSTHRPTAASVLSDIKSYLRNQYDESWVDSLTKNDYTINKITNTDGEDTKPLDGIYLIYFTVTKRDYINLKYGTVYYKWTRTIDVDNTAETFIGTDISIDADSFSGEYMIVGESLIREQQTGKDQRVQIVLPRTNISSTTSLKLESGGNPVSFAIDVNVLLPLDKNKSMIEMRLFNVEEDKIEGGYRVVPQNKEYAKTPIMEVFEEIVPQNNEIY